MDLAVDFIEPDGLAAANYKVVVVPWHLVGKESTCAALRRYVEAGGTLILEAGFGLYDERFFYNPVVPPHGLAEIFGYQEEHNLLVHNEKLPDDASPDDAIYYQPEIEFSEPAQIRMTARTFLTPLKLTSAEPNCLLARKATRRPQEGRSGRNASMSAPVSEPLYWRAMRGAMELLRSMVRSSCAARGNSRRKCGPGSCAVDGHSVLAVFNDTPQDQLGPHSVAG